MKFVELSRPHTSGRFVTPAVRRGLEVIASLVDGRSGHAAPAHANTGGLSLPDAQLMVHATGCSWPLLCAEAQDLAVLTGFDTMIVRTVPGETIGTYLSSIDLLLHEYPRWLLGYRPWIGDRHDDNWLVPCGAGPAVRLSPNGLSVSELLPFADLHHRDAGFERARWVFAYWQWRA